MVEPFDVIIKYSKYNKEGSWVIIKVSRSDGNYYQLYKLILSRPTITRNAR